MIIPMKKISLIFHSSELEKNIVELQELGIIDIEHGSFDYESSDGKEYLSLVHALEVLNTYKENNIDLIVFNNNEDVYAGTSLFAIAEEINGYHQEIQSLEKQNAELELAHKEASLIGDVSSRSLEALVEKQVQVSVYKTDKPTKILPSAENVRVVPLHIAKKLSYYAVIRYKDAEVQLPLTWQEYHLSEFSASEMKETIETNLRQIAELERVIVKKLEYERTLSIRKIELDNVLTRQAVANTGDATADQLLVLSGFFPKPEYTKVHAYVADKPWGVVIYNPSEDEEVPTLTKSFRIVNIVKPLFKLMDTIPGYKEFDISAMFLLFITLFFSMIIGDAGYGVLMFVATLLFTLKASRKGKVNLAHWLLLWFSFTTIIWGAVTGNWFGFAPFSEHHFLRRFIFEPIYGVNPSSKETIMLFSFRIGLVHLLLAHLWRIARYIRSSFFAVLHELANISLLFGLYFVVLNLILDPVKYPIPSFAIFAIEIGIIGIIITCEQAKGRNFFVGILKGLASLFNLFLGWIGNLAEIISYIRLFAVGLASLVIAQTFNTMGLSIIGTEASPVVSIIMLVAGALVIGVGHALNLAMALLAVMVHGVRLNMLEFGMHLGMEWTGRKFSPFQKKNIISLEDK